MRGGHRFPEESRQVRSNCHQIVQQPQAAFIGLADKYGIVDRAVKFSPKTKPGTRQVSVTDYKNHTYTISTTVNYRKK